MYVIKITLRSSRVTWFRGFVEQLSPTQIKIHVDLTEERDFATCFSLRDRVIEIAKAIGGNDSFAILQVEEA